MAKSSQNRLKRALKKRLKKIHPLTVFLMVVALVGGFFLGSFVCNTVSKNDRFVLCGQANTTLALTAIEGDCYLYTEEGVEAVCFGRDVSGTVCVKTDLQRDAEGKYRIPLDKEGTYTITYTVNAPKFGEKAPGGPIQRVRVFTVKAKG